MKVVVPVPELTLNEKNKSIYLVDPVKYSYLKDEVFFKSFEKYLKRRRIKFEKQGMNRFDNINNLKAHLRRFSKTKPSYIEYDNHFYVYDVKGVDWLAIELYEFSKIEELEDFLLNRSRLWRKIRQMFLNYIIK